jgi:hypothetical protein
MDRPAPSLFVEPRVADRRLRGGPLGLRRRRLLAIHCSAWLPPPAPVPWPANLRAPWSGLTAWRRAKPLRSIGLPCSSCCVAPSLGGRGRHRKGIQHFLRHVACLEGRVLAGSQIRTVLLSQWISRRHRRARQLKRALCNAAGHSEARETEHKTDTAVSLENGSLGVEVPKRVPRSSKSAPNERRRPEARIDNECVKILNRGRVPFRRRSQRHADRHSASKRSV